MVREQHGLAREIEGALVKAGFKPYCPPQSGFTVTLLSGTIPVLDGDEHFQPQKEIVIVDYCHSTGEFDVHRQVDGYFSVLQSIGFSTIKGSQSVTVHRN